jgi:hypothetical protein
VRPTDENQAGSTRPNLMSSRRGAGEENILAMLERDSARRTGPRMSGVRLASYGAAAALAGILVGGVAWLAWDNHQGTQEVLAQHQAVNEVNEVNATVPPVIPDAVLLPQAPPAVAAANPVDVPHTAVIVDESARKHDSIVASAPASTVPPLVMLPPHELNGTKPAPTAARVAPDTPPAKLAKSEPVPAPAVVQKQVPAQAPVLKQAQAPKQAKVQAKSNSEKKADKAQKPASRPAKPAAAPARAKGATRLAAKGKAEASRARKAAPNAEPAVDSDVALISAIIQHAERHRGERAVAPPAAPAKPSRR